MQTSPTQGAAFSSSKRLASLDIFRGLTIASMVLVNNQMSGAYTQLRHVEWSGWTFTDLVFPSFLWIAGVAATLSTARRIERGEDRGTLLAHAFRRTVIIFLLGVVLNFCFHPSFETARIPGVLQRIALCYFFGTLIYLYLPTKMQVLTVLALFAVYWLGMAPGGYEMGDNFAQRVDEALLPNHLYQQRNWDPEGFWSTLPSIGTFLFGVFTGTFLRSERRPGLLLLAGVLATALGLALDTLQPINKALWTVSFTMLTAGIATTVFAIIYWLVDIERQPTDGAKPLTIFGLNALGVYVFHELVSLGFGLGGEASLRATYAGILQGLGAANASLVYGLTHVAISFVFAWVLWRNRWFLKI